MVGVLALGAIGLYFATIAPLSDQIQKQSWSGQPCTVERSWINRSSSSQQSGTSYAPQIECSYQAQGAVRKAIAESYGTFKLEKQAKAVIRAHPKGSKTTCYVSPKQPERFVLERGLSAGPFILGAIILFASVGMAAAFWIDYKKKLARMES